MIEFNLLDIISVKQLSHGKQIVIVGCDERAYQLQNKLILFEMKQIAFLDLGEKQFDKIDDSIIVNIEEIACNKNAYYAVLFQNKYYNEQLNILNEKGLNYITDFIDISTAHLQTKLDKLSALDPTMGHGTWSANQYGCRFFGNVRDAKMRIAINGASLADETVFDWKIWPELLNERICEERNDIGLMIYASYGYTTSQCFLKFIRDIVPEKPDLLIDYCPWENDCFYGDNIQTPYVVGYQKKILKFLKGNITSRYENKKTDRLQLGRQIEMSTEKIIANNIIFTKKICDTLGIKYYCILPPSIITKKKNCCEEYEKYYSLGEKAFNAEKICKKALVDMQNELGESLVDARSWMDDYSDIFYDQFHMHEDGNNVIAIGVLKLLNDEFGKL